MKKWYKDIEIKLKGELQAKVNQQQKLTIDEQALYQRLNCAKHPTVEIAGHIFYVNYHLQKLEPSGDFMSSGIRFADLDDFHNDEMNRYEIPYDSNRRCIAEIDLDCFFEIPEGVFVVVIPYPSVMDRVGYARSFGTLYENILKEIPQKSHFKVEVLHGKDSYLEEFVKMNRKAEGLPPLVVKKKCKGLNR
ncbi:hypothetical protein [Fluviicola sp.]|uniref:hypothetical protein n=1 Tax=Fluviicola sp. TaxID=1917219 RepID=UPI0031D8E377